MNIKAQEYVLKVLKRYIPNRKFTTKSICSHCYAITNQFGVSVLVPLDYGEFEETLETNPINGIDGQPTIYMTVGALFMTSSELENDISKQCEKCFPMELSKTDE